MTIDIASPCKIYVFETTKGFFSFVCGRGSADTPSKAIGRACAQISDAWLGDPDEEILPPDNLIDPPDLLDYRRTSKRDIWNLVLLLGFVAFLIFIWRLLS